MSDKGKIQWVVVNNCINDQISHFVEQIRLQSGNDEDNDVRIVQPSTSAGVEADETRRKAEATVIEVEKFQAAPTGNFEISNPQIVNKVPVQNIPNIGGGVSDDDFFHLVCHIEPNLIHKIENGEFIELEKLLPKSSVGNVSAGHYSNCSDEFQSKVGGFRESVGEPLISVKAFVKALMMA